MIRDISAIRSANHKIQSSMLKVQREKSSQIKKRHPLRDAA